MKLHKINLKNNKQTQYALTNSQKEEFEIEEHIKDLQRVFNEVPHKEMIEINAGVLTSFLLTLASDDLKFPDLCGRLEKIAKKIML